MTELDWNECIAKLEQCLVDVESWTVQNKLQLNASKTEILHITSMNRKVTPLADVQVTDTRVKPSFFARNLGVILDDKLCMTQHVNNICRNATHAIRCIGRFIWFLALSCGMVHVNSVFFLLFYLMYLSIIVLCDNFKVLIFWGSNSVCCRLVNF